MTSTFRLRTDDKFSPLFAEECGTSGRVYNLAQWNGLIPEHTEKAASAFLAPRHGDPTLTLCCLFIDPLLTLTFAVCLSNCFRTAVVCAFESY